MIFVVVHDLVPEAHESGAWNAVDERDWMSNQSNLVQFCSVFSPPAWSAFANARAVLNCKLCALLVAAGNGSLASWGCMVGFVVMMSMDVGLG